MPRYRSTSRAVCFVATMVTALLALSSGVAGALELERSSVKGTLSIDLRKPANDHLSLRGEFQPASGTTPDVDTLPVTFNVGTFSQVLPAGAFQQTDGRGKTTWTFKGATGGLTEMTLTRPAAGSWTFSARGAGLVLAGVTNPIDLALQIGNDQGAARLFFVVKTNTATRRLLKVPPGRRDDADGDGATIAAGDCDDQDPTVQPGAVERCDGVDDDCDGDIDEGFDLGGSCALGIGACHRNGVVVCAPGGAATVCDATPGLPAPERCGNQVDDDCDGATDEGFDVGAQCTAGTGSCQRDGLEICAPDGSGTVCDVAADPTCTPGPAIDIVDPANLTSFTQLVVPVSGTVRNGVVEVGCNGFLATLTADTFRANVTLEEGTNVIACVARDAAGLTRTASLSVTVDTEPPRVTITAPAEGATVGTSPLTVTGLINDVVVGTVNQQEARVDCNGARAQIANRTFIATDVALVAGPNAITCVGTDAAGNADSARVHVTLTAPNGPVLRIETGDGQTGPIGTRLAQPLVVSVSDRGAPLPGKTVLFRVLRNDGTLAAGQASGRLISVLTNEDGQARVDYTLGTWAGAGNNQVLASAAGVAGEVVFSESAAPGASARIVVDAGTNQEGAVDARLPLPFVAVVIDQGNNRLAGIPVTFRVSQGGGNLDGQPSLTVNTDSDGRAEAALTLGPDETPDGNVVAAGFAGNSGPGAVFVASGKVPGDPAETRVSGVVLDNTNQPIPGVTFGIEDPTSTTTPRALLSSVQSDAQGQFVLTSVPVGHVFLFVEGATAQRPGFFPRLEYELVTVAGRNNTVGMPIYLLPIDIAHGIEVDDVSGGTITLPDVPGFSLTVLPGSVTFLNGTHRGTVSVTPVHPDKVPMVPSFGQQPRFIVTIQPAGVHFNPPAAMTIPNADGLAPGQKTEMYSFDHDLGQFVSIGPGTVSDDGSVIASDPGVGVIKGGWHSASTPPPPGEVLTCDDGNPCTDDEIDFEPNPGGGDLKASCNHDALDDGSLCTPEPPVPGATIRCGDDFIDIEIAASCDSHELGNDAVCLDAVCKAGPFNSNEVASSLNSAISNICTKGPGCIGATLRNDMHSCLRDNGLKVSCDATVPPGSECAHANLPERLFNGCLRENGKVVCANEVVLAGDTADHDECPVLSSVVLHELVHDLACDPGAGGIDQHNTGVGGPTDRPYGCEESCFPGSSGGRGTPGACQ